MSRELTIRTSRGRSLLVALLAVGGVRALALCEPPAPLLALGAFAIVAIAAHDLLRPRPSALARSADGLWHVLFSNGKRTVGRLTDTGYRSAALIVLVLEEERSTAGAGPESAGGRAPWRRRRRRVAVFADSVDASDFSFLHLQLAFAGRDR